MMLNQQNPVNPVNEWGLGKPPKISRTLFAEGTLAGEIERLVIHTRATAAAEYLHRAQRAPDAAMTAYWTGAASMANQQAGERSAWLGLASMIPGRDIGFINLGVVIVPVSPSPSNPAPLAP